MRKSHKYFFAILFLCICGNVFPQSSLSHLSLENGYNTLSIEYQIRGTGEYPHWVSKHFWTLLIKPKKDSQFITFGGGYPETAAFSWLDQEELLRIYIKNFLNSIDYIINKEWMDKIFLKLLQIGL